MNKQELSVDQSIQILDNAIASIPAKRDEHQLLMEALKTLAQASQPQKIEEGETNND